MVTTVELSARNEKKYSMEEHWMWYLTGSIDSVATITCKIVSDSAYGVGYKIKPMVYYTRPKNMESIFGMLTEYMEKNNIKYRIDEMESSRRLVISGIDSTRQFLEPVQSGFVQQRERVDVFLNDVLPSLEKMDPSSKEEFIDVVGVVDEMRECPMKTRQGTKFDQMYFVSEWQEEIS